MLEYFMNLKKKIKILNDSTILKIKDKNVNEKKINK